ncbi:Pkinase-domain-containing protein [Auriculariales sp. MPI-PUGE-AT-0066]|nr:Pkinase-domain-containing protein [Auriculariales sp. MPI-PUGE-AT-0066]
MAGVPTAGPSRSLAVGKKTSAFFSSPFATPPPELAPEPYSPDLGHGHGHGTTTTHGFSHVYQRLNGVPTPPGSVYNDSVSELGDHLSTYSGSPPLHYTTSPATHLARLRSLKVAKSGRRDEDARDLRRASSLRLRSEPVPPLLYDSPTSPTAPTFAFPPSSPKSNALRMSDMHLSPPSSPVRLTHPPARLRSGDALEPSPGSRFVLQRVLGRGAFSSVWLARDESWVDTGTNAGRRRSECAAPKRGERVQGLRPPGSRRDASLFLSAAAAGDNSLEHGHAELVAVKIMDRAACDANDRTRISFVREVEVLRHIDHPNIVAYRHAFSTPTSHCLVLSYASGGELFDIVSEDSKWAAFHLFPQIPPSVNNNNNDDDDDGARAKRQQHGDGTLLRRIVVELARAVAWLHSVHVVHRDIKLENILLTAPLSAVAVLSGPAAGDPSPLVKLADFGLARFIDPARPRLTTRCGSEAYAAPELIMSGSRSGGGGGGGGVVEQDDDFDESRSLGHSTGSRSTMSVISGSETTASSSSSSDEGPGTPPALDDDDDVLPANGGGTTTTMMMSPPPPPKVHLEPPSPAPPDADAHGYDPRATDAWALGTVLYALATRALPFGAAESPRERRLAALAQYTWPVADVEAAWPSEVGRAVRETVARLLVRDARERWSVKRLVEEDAWLAGCRRRRCRRRRCRRNVGALAHW